MRMISPVLRTLKRLRRDRSGTALIEFAYSLPILVGLTVTGMEVSHFALCKLRLSQLARLAADNVARYQPALSLTNVDDVISGVKKAGEGIKFAQKGRIIISGLQRNSGGTGQWINWQRCSGAKVVNSSYGGDDAGYNSAAIQGMGPTGNQIASPSNTIFIVFVEVAYDYQPLISNNLLGAQEMKTSQAFIVRSRQTGNISGAYTVDSSGAYVRSGGGARTATTQGASVANCANYSA